MANKGTGRHPQSKESVEVAAELLREKGGNIADYRVEEEVRAVGGKISREAVQEIRRSLGMPPYVSAYQRRRATKLSVVNGKTMEKNTLPERIRVYGSSATAARRLGIGIPIRGQGAVCQDIPGEFEGIVKAEAKKLMPPGFVANMGAPSKKTEKAEEAPESDLPAAAAGLANYYSGQEQKPNAAEPPRETAGEKVINALREAVAGEKDLALPLDAEEEKILDRTKYTLDGHRRKRLPSDIEAARKFIFKVLDERGGKTPTRALRRLLRRQGIGLGDASAQMIRREWDAQHGGPDPSRAARVMGGKKAAITLRKVRATQAHPLVGLIRKLCDEHGIVYLHWEKDGQLVIRETTERTFEV